MARTLARSLRVAERAALAGENDSQDSQDKLLFLIREHGIGVTTSSPTDDEPWSVGKGLARAPTSVPSTEGEKPSRQPPHIENASNAPADNLDTAAAPADVADVVDVNVDTNTDAVSAPPLASSVKTSSQRPRDLGSSAPPSSAASSASAVQTAVQPVPRDTCLADRPPISQTRDDPIPVEKPAGAMSSQSPTQTNEGRSYEQYARDGSQPSSPPGSFMEEHRTLQEGDTGYVDFKYPLDLPDTAPIDPDTPLNRNNERDSLHARSPFTAQPTTIRNTRFVPETPATLPKPFLDSADGHVLPASQLFGQTQPTSALKKASPTSSRPSPNVFGKTITSPTNPTSSPLKNRGLGTSPLPNFVPTSPSVPERSSGPLDTETPQSLSLVDASGAGGDREEEEADKTPRPELRSRRARTALEPIEEYRPYRKHVSDSDVVRSSSQRSLDSDFERDEAELRRQRARSNKEKASKSFPQISVPRPSSSRAKVEVPSTNRAKCLTEAAPTNPKEDMAHHEKYTGHDGLSQETVADSQDTTTQQKSTNETDMAVLPASDQDKLRHKGHCRTISVPLENIEKEIIPETSPTCTLAEPPKLISDIIRESSSVSSGLLTLSYPMPSTGALVESSRSLNEPSQSERSSSAPAIIDANNKNPVGVVSSPSIVLASSQESDRRRSGRLTNMTTPSSRVSQPLLPSDPCPASSTLTALSTTPAISSSWTSNAEDDHHRGHIDDSTSISSSTVDRREQHRGPSPSSLTEPSPSTRPKTSSRPRRNLRKAVRQASRQSSLSLDELDKSSSVSTPEDSRTSTRKPSRKSTTLREFQTKVGIFEGMVFAISFQDRQQPQRFKDRSLSKSSLEEMIRQEGGKILDDGFNELFEFDTLRTSTKASSTPIVSSSLSLIDGETGFAALIADGHSRKVKYMQALALGIPCLAPKWVTACVAKKEIVDWSSYLLCAGPSTLLGDAIRSRNLPPYDASTARLAQVISQRPRLLDKSKILLIMKKTKNEEKKLPYVFLAQVLGASLVRVQSVEEARGRLREAESGNGAFNWVYVDDHLQEARTALFGSGSSAGSSKKQKRTRVDTDAGDQPPKRIRTLNDELVIQSLILGRLIEEDEMEE
ncbi:hypothetical protein F4802DRAFT_434216 [Xylaria palmicola]|nr:hypothetical protein F4802DRAFT_434216 [Xylaria palmicola]